MQRSLKSSRHCLSRYNTLLSAFSFHRPVTAKMSRILLTEEEQRLRSLLLDVSDYIASQEGCVKPELRFTGGWVRDKLLGLTSKDIDIGISCMTGYRFGTLMKQYLKSSAAAARYSQDVIGTLSKIAANPEKSKHLETVATKIMGMDIDLVNLRKETYVEDSRNPTMQFGTAEEDALRRDSTVNALFYNLSSEQVEDFTGKGLHDMELKIIRTPLSPYQTFKDDPLRVLRCIRFASALDYTLDAEAEQSMRDPEIKKALRAKITRERIGVEINKMLKGPRPHVALSYIDRLHLYDVVFTDPNTNKSLEVETRTWSRAYNQLFHILQDSHTDASGQRDMQVIREILLTETEQIFLAWLLCSLTPWARTKASNFHESEARPPFPIAAVVAREGLKLDNKSLSIVKNSVLHFDDIIASKLATSNGIQASAIPMKRKRSVLTRDRLGMSIRRWGTNWRSSVVFALLVQSMEAEHENDRSDILNQYATWLSIIKDQDLLDVCALKPIVDGKRLQKELNRKPGPWMAAALDMAMEWQLRNPEETEPNGAIEEILVKHKELDIG